MIALPLHAHLCSDAAAVAAMMPDGSLQATGVSLDARFRTSVGGALTINLHGDSLTSSGVSLAAVDADNDSTITASASVNNAEREAAVDSQQRSSTAAAAAAAERAAAEAAAQAAAAADVTAAQATDDNS
jgi:hypothetical protein